MSLCFAFGKISDIETYNLNVKLSNEISTITSLLKY